MPRKTIAVVLGAVAIVAATLWASGRTQQPFIPVLALLLLVIAASLFGKTNRFADRLRLLVGRKVRVFAWGAELHGVAGTSFILDKVLAIGPGLHIYLRLVPHGSPVHMKIAQPSGATMDDLQIEISDAKYVQWAGRKILKKRGQSALFLNFIE